MLERSEACVIQVVSDGEEEMSIQSFPSSHTSHSQATYPNMLIYSDRFMVDPMDNPG